MQPFSAMKPSTPHSPAHLIAESIRTQLGTDALVLITPGSPRYAIVVAQAADMSAQAATDPEPDREPAGNDQRGERLAYSVDEAASALGLSRDLIYDQLRSVRLESLKVGRRRIITREQIDKFLAGC